MAPEPFISMPDRRMDELGVIGTNISILADASHTNGVEVTLQSGAEGAGPPPHSHGWDEFFYVLSGSVTMHCNGKETLCEAGAMAYVPGGTVHAFSFGPGGGQMLEFTHGNSQASGLFRQLSKDIAPGPPDIDAVRRVFDDNQVTPHF